MLSDDLGSIRTDLCIETIHEKVSLAHQSEALYEALVTSDRILDLTASLGASRTISAISKRSPAISAFFNPSGSAVVVLQEDAARTLDLASLEALYYAEICHNRSLCDHLWPGDQAVVSGGQCRAVTSRIPASKAAILSSIAASVLGKNMPSSDASITIASINADGGTNMHRVTPTIGSVTVNANGWKICLADAVARKLQDFREAHLPSETGGILLGVVDHAQKRIEISMGLEAPPDSSGSTSSFERGIQGTIDSIAEARARTMHQLTYIGEWHSHPRGARTAPSLTDAAQLVMLREELKAEQRPPVMVIVGDSGSNPVSLELYQ
ncbi:Mov34/MPN/PAD-1 family protein [Gymnodinialimonas sp.]